MTLCIAWRQQQAIHLASDSRLTIANNSYADVGIKVLSIPYRILQPASQDASQPREVAYQGQLGMCFAGSAINSLMIKESVASILQDLQHAPGYTDVSLQGISNFIFKAYKLISKKVCETAIGHKGIADFIICGQCHVTNELRAFKFATNLSNEHSLMEVLLTTKHEFLGSGASQVTQAKELDRNVEYLALLRDVILDDSVPSVGGNIQYGTLHNNGFKIFGIAEHGESVHYWRGALDVNSSDFLSAHDDLIPGITCIDPFDTFRTQDAA